MRDRSKDVPSDEEMLEAAVANGWVEPGEALPPRLRARSARVVQEAWREGAAAAKQQVSAAAFSLPILAIMSGLTSGPDAISETSAARIVAAVAPAIWRETNRTTNVGAAHS